jgi:hypothetical protein
VLGHYTEPHVQFIKASVSRGIAYGIYGLLFLIFNWPRVLTYMAIVWMLVPLPHPVFFRGRDNWHVNWNVVGLFAFKCIVLGTCICFLGF